AAWIEDGIRASVYDDSGMHCELAIVSMRPNTRVLLEIGFSKPSPVSIAPESEWLRHEGSSAHEFPLCFNQGAARFVPELDGHSQAAALQFAPIHRQSRIAGSERRDDVSATGDGRKANIL